MDLPPPAAADPEPDHVSGQPGPEGLRAGDHAGLVASQIAEGRWELTIHAAQCDGKGRQNVVTKDHGRSAFRGVFGGSQAPGSSTKRGSSTENVVNGTKLRDGASAVGAWSDCPGEAPGADGRSDSGQGRRSDFGRGCRSGSAKVSGSGFERVSCQAPGGEWRVGLRGGLR